MDDQIRQIEITEVNETNVGDINTMDNSFEIKSRIVPSIKDGAFVFTIEETKGLHYRTYPDDKFDYTTYIKNLDKMAYLAYINDEAVGQITLRRWWNKFAWIEDIRVESNRRRSGIGTMLMDAAVKWARGAEMPGIMLETQDTNVPACLFYHKYGFILGGVDKIPYRGSENSSETALFWYFIF